MAGSGSKEATLALVYVKGKPIECTAIDWNDESETVVHRATDSHNVKSHSLGDKKYKVDLEWDKKSVGADFDPSAFDANNPVDVVIVEPQRRLRFVQGVKTALSAGMKVSDKWTGRCTLGEFKDCRPE